MEKHTARNALRLSEEGENKQVQPARAQLGSP
jgi:hypothetical protein